MNNDTIGRNWIALGGEEKHQWGKLTNDRLEVIAIKRDQLEAEIRQAYSIIKSAGRELEPSVAF